MLSLIFGIIAFCLVNIATAGNGTVTSWTTSGLSSGAYFTAQMGVAFSSECTGIGVVAGGPYYCAQARETEALTACMTSPFEINLNKLESDAEQFASDNLIDPLSNIANQKIYLFSAKYDTDVATGVVQDAQKWFDHFGANTTFDTSQNCAHGMVTNFYGPKCPDHLEEPYIYNCNYDLAGKILQFIYQNTLKPAISPNNVPYNNVVQVNQKQFVPSGATPSGISVQPIAYVYVASNCSIAPLSDNCKLHVAFHGCKMDLDSNMGRGAKYNDTYVRNAGYNQWAEPNNIVVLYPQAASSALSNPQGCWDWWGYNTKNYAFKTGKQSITVHNMIQWVLNG